MEDKIKAILAQTLTFSSTVIELGIDDNDTLRDLGADSLDAVELSLNLEDEFGIEISGDEAPELFTGEMTVRGLVAFVESKVQDVE